MTTLTPLEIAAGTVVGVERALEPLAPSDRPLRESLEAAILDGLRRPPCRIAFSGGVDSSLVLVLAADLARRHGLEPPVPVSARFPAFEETAEEEWQEMVLERCGLRDRWVAVDIGDELGLVGPLAHELLSATGEVYWPWNLHFLMPMARAGGPGGCLMTGVGGDELLNFAGWARLELVLMRRHRPRLADLPALAVPFAPALVRAGALYATRPLAIPWLTRRAASRFNWEWACQEGAWGWRWDAALLDRGWRSRYIQIPRRFTTTLDRLTGVRTIHPFQMPAVLSSAATHFGRRGPINREAALEGLGGELLPPRVRGRRDKATFNAAMWTDPTRRFSEQALEALPPELARLVDRRTLIRSWSQPVVSSVSYSLLQAGWLASGLPLSEAASWRPTP